MKAVITHWRQFLETGPGRWLNDLGLLVARLGFGGTMIWLHGWGKLTGFGELAPKFADPLGIGTTASLALATFAEFFCSLAVMAGFATRLAILPLIPTMIVAINVANANRPGGGELAMIYLIGFVTLLLTGPGRFSVDHAIAHRLG